MNTENKNINYICNEWLENKKLSIKYSSYVKYKKIITMYILPFFEENE